MPVKSRESMLAKYLSPDDWLRPWELGVHDCYTLIRDVYLRVAGITLPEFPRQTESPYLEAERYFDPSLWRAAGFRLVVQSQVARPSQQELLSLLADLKELDILLFATTLMRFPGNPEAYIPTHAGIMLEPSSNYFIHHPMSSLPQVSILGNYWRGRLKYILRHESQENTASQEAPASQALPASQEDLHVA